ncbi:hypothetical protein KGF86_16620 [Ornithinibacillus massiliensis]|uniref:Uncharacterized protein n=1 Tax=Ornithinibacillus massiliensis TaxID=1944633 RepID=A0ABS5MHM6_9BACI|nr:hypothetical protein [Ornithinibacillus massiliensis]MBS3681818.1 hypothetical protein [Ornithinibacillus massiliensis]
MEKRKCDSYQEEELRVMGKKLCEKHRESEGFKCWCYDCHDECDCKKDHKKDHKKDDKKDHKKDGHKDKANLKNFEFYTLNPNVQQPNRFELPVDVQTPVASVTLDKVKKGDVVWLNGVFGLDNDDPDDFATIIMRIYKGSPSVFIPGEEIYRAVIEIDDAGNDDQVLEPLAHVDVITENDENVTYTVTLETDEDPVFLNGPVTFTAALISTR